MLVDVVKAAAGENFLLDGLVRRQHSTLLSPQASAFVVAGLWVAASVSPIVNIQGGSSS